MTRSSRRRSRKLVGVVVPVLVGIVGVMSSSPIWALVVCWDLTLVTLASVPVAMAGARLSDAASDK